MTCLANRMWLKGHSGILIGSLAACIYATWHICPKGRQLPWNYLSTQRPHCWRGRRQALQLILPAQSGLLATTARGQLCERRHHELSRLAHLPAEYHWDFSQCHTKHRNHPAEPCLSSWPKVAWDIIKCSCFELLSFEVICNSAIES